MTTPHIVWAALLGVAAVVVQACAPDLGPASATPSQTLRGTSSPAATHTLSGSTPSPTESASPSGAQSVLPPTAYLGFDSTEVEGELRTYCWLDTCADAFELPPMDELPLLTLEAAITSLDLHLAADAAFISWRASYGNGGMEDLVPLDAGGEEYDPDTTATLPPLLARAAVAAPPPGDWIVYVVIRAVDGEAHHAWHVRVP